MTPNQCISQVVVCGYGDGWSWRVESERKLQKLSVVEMEGGCSEQFGFSFQNIKCKSSIRILGSFSKPSGYVLERLCEVNRSVCSDRVRRGVKGALREKVSWAQQKGSRLYCSVGGAGLVPTTSISTTTPYNGLEGEMERELGGKNNVRICHKGSVCSSCQFGVEARSKI